jgi:hypothetical protein
MTKPIAEALDDTDYRLRILWGLRADRLNNGEFVATLTLARPETTETSALHLDTLRDLKSVNKHIVAAACLSWAGEQGRVVGNEPASGEFGMISGVVPHLDLACVAVHTWSQRKGISNESLAYVANRAVPPLPSESRYWCASNMKHCWSPERATLEDGPRDAGR